MTEAAVLLEGVGKRFPGADVPALRGVRGRIAFGGITGLVGPDGAGKTTLIRLVAGLLRPSEGRLEVLGHDPSVDAAPIHARIGYMPQAFGLYEELTVAENLRLYADLRGLVGPGRERTFERLLRFTDLAPFTARRAGALSGGMKQKLGLACALLKRPRLLLLDEPSVGVDPISRRELWSMVQELVEEDVAVLWSTAYLDEAERCDEVILLSEGAPVFVGRPGDLTARVQGRSVQIRGVAEGRRQVLARALERDDVTDGVIQGSRVRLLMAPEAEPPAPEALGAGEGASVVAVEPRFEDAFVDALGGGPGGRSALAASMPPIEGGRGEEVVVRAHALTRRFGDFTAADRVSFEVRRGEIFGLLGPNGAGKSTTFKMLCGLLRPTAGEAQVAGLDLARARGQARARLGYMAQKFSLYGALSVAQNLAFFSRAYGLRGRARPQAVERMVDVFGFGAYLHTAAAELPLGFKQRLGLACALMHQPAVLFLDEPTSGVDPITRREFWTHINGLVERGVTVIVTTHFMDEAEYCDRIGLIFRGRLAATGTPDELKAASATPERPDPTLEDAFIARVRAEREEADAA